MKSQPKPNPNTVPSSLQWSKSIVILGFSFGPKQKQWFRLYTTAVYGAIRQIWPLRSTCWMSVSIKLCDFKNSTLNNSVAFLFFCTYNTKIYEMSFKRLGQKFRNNFTPLCYVKVKALLSLTLSLVMSPCISVCVAKNGAWCALKKIQLWSLVQVFQIC